MSLVVSLLILGQASAGPPPPLPIALTVGNQSGLNEKQVDALLDSMADVVKAQGFLVTKAPAECAGKRDCAKAFAVKSGQAAFISVGLAAGLTQTLVDIEAISTKTDATLLQQNFALKKKEEARDLKLALTGLGATLRATLATEKTPEVKQVATTDKPDAPKDVKVTPDPKPDPTPVPPPGLSGRKVAAITLMGTSVAAFVASIVLVAVGLNGLKPVPDTNRVGFTWQPPTCEKAMCENDRNNLLTGSLIASLVGAGLLGAGAVLFLTDTSPAAP